MVTSASICSVTRMLPSSAAIALPARAATINAENTGAISSISEFGPLINQPCPRAEITQAVRGLQREHHAAEDPGQRHDEHRLHADEFHRQETAAQCDTEGGLAKPEFGR